MAFALVVLGVAQASANVADEPKLNASDIAAVDQYTKKEMEATRLLGLALGIVKGDRIVHLKGFGEADDSGSKVTPETPLCQVRLPSRLPRLQRCNWSRPASSSLMLRCNAMCPGSGWPIRKPPHA
jgi:hypothetical protein